MFIKYDRFSIKNSLSGKYKINKIVTEYEKKRKEHVEKNYFNRRIYLKLIFIRLWLLLEQ
jgi:hypothetical protein